MYRASKESCCLFHECQLLSVGSCIGCHTCVPRTWWGTCEIDADGCHPWFAPYLQRTRGVCQPFVAISSRPIATHLMVVSRDNRCYLPPFYWKPVLFSYMAVAPYGMLRWLFSLFFNYIFIYKCINNNDNFLSVICLLFGLRNSFIWARILSLTTRRYPVTTYIRWKSSMVEQEPGSFSRKLNLSSKPVKNPFACLGLRYYRHGSRGAWNRWGVAPSHVVLEKPLDLK